MINEPFSLNIGGRLKRTDSIWIQFWRMGSILKDVVTQMTVLLLVIFHSKIGLFEVFIVSLLRYCAIYFCLSIFSAFLSWTCSCLHSLWIFSSNVFPKYFIMKKFKYTERFLPLLYCMQYYNIVLYLLYHLSVYTSVCPSV